ncbi:MAG: serine protein kinase RIO [Thermosphaera sp.]
MSDDMDRLLRRGSEEPRIKDADLYETVEEVFDSSTVLTIVSLIRKRVLKRLAGVVSAGKEARVYLGYAPDGRPLAVKIYLTSSAEFRRGILKYIMGDPRFQRAKLSDTRSIIYAWTRKEYRNLVRMKEAGVKVPQPVAFLNNVLVMEFLGEDGRRYPLLEEAYRDLEAVELESIYTLALEELEKIVCKAKLVHGDFSEFNIMVKPDLDVAVIDVSQAVDHSHPNARDFLERDVRNINRFFKNEAKINVLSEEEVLEGLLRCLERRRVGSS